MTTAAKKFAEEAQRFAQGKSYTVMIVAGEASSDQHAASLISALKLRLPGGRFFGMGGSRLRECGVDTVIDSETTASVMGVTELGGSIKKLVRAFQVLRQRADLENPDLVILVDFPDFNLRMAKAMHKRGAKVLYFISPQLWAWRPGRIKQIKKYVDRVAAIFPFEESYYQERGVAAEFVGHPFLDRPEHLIGRERFLRSIGLLPERPTVALLPGSRHAEIERLLGPMLEAFDRLQISRPGIQAAIPVAPALPISWFQKQIGARKGIALIQGQASQLLSVADVAVVASGTATVEAALARIPFVVVYKLAPLTYRLARLLVTGVRYVAMANLIAAERVVPELLQNEVTGERIAEELERYLGDEALRASVRDRLGVVRERLSLPSSDGLTAGGRAARVAEQLIIQKQGHN